MKTSIQFICLLAAALAMGIGALTTPAHAADKKAPFKVKGLYLEGCSCGIPCPCELSGLAKGCEGVGALVLESGSYDGQKLDGAKVAYATIPGKWVRLYIESKDAAVRKTAEAFARNAFAPFGKIESVEDATIAVTGKEGKYTLEVNGGKTMKLTTEPVLGGDNKTAISIHNTKSALSPVFNQAKSVSGSFSDKKEKFSFKDTNSYFNEDMDSSGEV